MTAKKRAKQPVKTAKTARKSAGKPAAKTARKPAAKTARKPMQLDLESGRVIRNVKASQLRAAIEAEQFAILGTGSRGNTYMQCAVQDAAPWQYILEYQERSVDHHYRAVHQGIPLAAVTAAFAKYLAGDPSWKTDFEWEWMDLS
jgi:hypothetical protein